MKNSKLKRVIFLSPTLLIISLCFAFGCSTEKQYENYQLSAPGDIVLTLQNHPHGYYKSQCFNCHFSENIHQVDRIGSPNFSLARPLVEQQGLKSCAACHGNNGVQ